MPDLTPARLAELRALAERATPGEWEVESVSDAVRAVRGHGRQKVILFRGNPKQIKETETDANVRLAVALRNDATALLDTAAEVATLRAERAALVAVARAAVESECCHESDFWPQHDCGRKDLIAALAVLPPPLRAEIERSAT